MHATGSTRPHHPVDPLRGLRGEQGLRPIDLAARRGQDACERLLAEYHMHHSISQAGEDGSGAFDSVLFLATLEGHRQCKRLIQTNGLNRLNGSSSTGASNGTAKKVARGGGGGGGGSSRGGGEEEPYTIIKRAPNDRSALARTESLWSLRRHRSMRLEQWGDWIAYEDILQNDGEGGLDKAVEEGASDGMSMGSGPRGGSGSGSGGSGGGSKGGEETKSTDGMVFWYNTVTEEHQWSPPQAAIELQDRANRSAGSIGSMQVRRQLMKTCSVVNNLYAEANVRRCASLVLGAWSCETHSCGLGAPARFVHTSA